MQAALTELRDGGFRADINGLRGLSIALVVAFHLHLRGADGGFIGVDVFFVISGYLMTKIILGSMAEGNFSYWRFIAARAARIWPALSALVVVLLAVGFVVLPPMDVRTLAEQAVRALAFVSNQFFLERSGYDTRTADTQWLLHTWSLSVEWQFYMLYPLLFIGLARSRRTLVLLLAALLIASWVGCLLVGAAHPSSAFFLLPTRAWEMLAGGLAFLAPPLLAKRPVLRAVAVHVSLLLVLGVALWLGVRHVRAEEAGWVLVLPVAAVALMLWAGDAGNRVLGVAPLQKLGAWSYSIYLWHWPIIVGLRMTNAFLDHPAIASAAAVVLAVACGALSYRFIESASLRSSRLRKPLAGMGIAAALTAAAVFTAGFAFRSSEPGFGADYAASVKALYFPERCGNFMKTAVQTLTCEIDKASVRRVLVIGDSHAEHLYPWFVAHSSVSVDFFTQAECPPVPRFDRMQAGFHCMDYTQAAWQLAADGRYDTVVLAARWATVGADGAPYCHAVGDGHAPCTVEPVQRKQALINEELASAVKRLLSQGKTIVMLKPTPEARVRVPERITREMFWRGKVELAIDQASFGATVAWLTPLFEELQALPRFHLLSLEDRLCTAGACSVFDAERKRPIFIDESHFDPVWITHNAGVFAPFVRKD
ncbi:MAG: acyltransferase family protein [Rhizobacter sp.]